jgi:hypothetical protein
MTRAEVEAILGGPPGGYGTEWTDLERDPSLPPIPEDGDLWSSDDGGVIVAFDDSQRVRAHGWIRPTYGPKWSLRRWIRRVELWWRDREE